jgi:NTP pyrophosphatase (non-canonical NTP hydrolase)
MDIEKIILEQRKFVGEREWEPFHTPKNLAMALAGEAGELLEIFQWLTTEEASNVMQNPDKSKALKHELADIFFYLLRLSDTLGVDLEKALVEKMELNALKYPVEKSRGSAKKYTEL